MMDPHNEYCCELCGGTFKKGWSDKEAKAEAKANFGNMEPEEESIVCEDCYQVLMKWLERNPEPLPQ